MTLCQSDIHRELLLPANSRDMSKISHIDSNHIESMDKCMCISVLYSHTIWIRDIHACVGEIKDWILATIVYKQHGFVFFQTLLMRFLLGGASCGLQGSCSSYSATPNDEPQIRYAMIWLI